MFGYNPNETDSEWTQAGKPAEHNPKDKFQHELLTSRKINSNMNYSHPTQHKRLALNIALSQRSIPRGRVVALVLQHWKHVLQCPCGAAEVLLETISPPLALQKPPGVEVRQPHRVSALGAPPLALLG